MKVSPTSDYLLVRVETAPMHGTFSLPSIKGYMFGKVVETYDEAYKNELILYRRYSDNEIWQDDREHHLVRKEDVVAHVEM